MENCDTNTIDMLKRAQQNDIIAEEDIIRYIVHTYMHKRIGRYLNRNRQAESDDIKQEFMIGVALGIRTVRFDIGNPIEYLISQGVYRVRSYLRKQIITNTFQICNECGYITRLNKMGCDYICKKCGSNNISTNELNDHNEIILESITDNSGDFDIEVTSQMLLDKFEDTLDKNTNVYRLYSLLISGINRDNPNVKNYIHEIATIWGGCSDQNVVQNMDKLKNKIYQFAYNNNMIIKDNSFIDM